LVLVIAVWVASLISRLRKGRIMSVWWSIVLVVFVAYSILALALYFMQPAFLYSPVRQVPYNPSDINLPFENIVFETKDRLKLSAWFIPAEKAELTVLFCHGNGGNMTHRLDTINILNELGLNCFIFDYRGYGASEGKPSEAGTYRDAEAAYKWLTQKKSISPENIILFGRSLGGSIAAYLATKIEAKALIVESSFTSYVDIGKKFYPYMPIRLAAIYSYPTIDYIRRVRYPVMIIHSRNDEIIPFEFGLRLYDAANEPKEFIEISGSHNDGFLFSGETYRKAWSNWLEFLKDDQPATGPVLRRIS
jgi:fermentation-respiration switch protein FrsA (DUF1100 family)